MVEKLIELPLDIDKSRFFEYGECRFILYECDSYTHLCVTRMTIDGSSRPTTAQITDIVRLLSIGDYYRSDSPFSCEVVHLWFNAKQDID